jgi:hypothetical protein
VRLEGLGQLKKSNDLIRTQTRDLPACSIMPQPTKLPRAQLIHVLAYYLFLCLWFVHRHFLLNKPQIRKQEDLYSMGASCIDFEDEA